MRGILLIIVVLAVALFGLYKFMPSFHDWAQPKLVEMKIIKAEPAAPAAPDAAAPAEAPPTATPAEAAPTAAPAEAAPTAAPPAEQPK